MAKIQPWEAEVDEGSATATPKQKKVIPKPAPKPEAEDDGPPTDSKGNYIKPRPFAKGGSVSARADGCCIKGKTKGRMV